MDDADTLKVYRNEAEQVYNLIGYDDVLNLFIDIIKYDDEGENISMIQSELCRHAVKKLETKRHEY